MDIFVRLQVASAKTAAESKNNFVLQTCTLLFHTSFRECLMMSQYCAVVDRCGKGHRCSGICFEHSASELLRVVTAVEEFDVRATGSDFGWA